MSRSKKDIEVGSMGPIAELAQALRDVRGKAGDPTYETMAKIGFSSKATLSMADRGGKLPTRAAIEAYLRGCDASLEDFKQILGLWRQLKTDLAVRADGPAESKESRSQPPDPWRDLSVEGLIKALRGVLVWCGNPSYKTLADRARASGEHLPSSTLGDMLTKNRLPKVETMEAFLRVCAVPAADWLAAYAQIASLMARESRMSITVTQKPVFEWPASEMACDLQPLDLRDGEATHDIDLVAQKTPSSTVANENEDEQCWPPDELAVEEPAVPDSAATFLGSGVIAVEWRIAPPTPGPSAESGGLVLDGPGQTTLINGAQRNDDHHKCQCCCHHQHKSSKELRPFDEWFAAVARDYRG